MAQTQGALPPQVDAGRIHPPEPGPTPLSAGSGAIEIPGGLDPAPAPDGASQVRFTLESLAIEGSSVYGRGELASLYASRLHTQISLADLYDIAAGITRRYRADGYFLSLALVPDQDIKGGAARIRVVEGYVSEVRFPKGGPQGALLGRYVRALTARRPATAQDLESFLVRIGDLPGMAFRAILSRTDGAPDGAVVLTLKRQPQTLRGAVSLDNYGSRYLGPHEVSATVSASFGGLNETTLSVLTSAVDPRLSYVALHESLAVWPDFVVSLDASSTRAFPGAALKAEDINSTAVSYGLRVTYTWLRRRDLRVTLQAGIDGRDVSSTILGQPLTRDRVRAVRFGLDYQAFSGGGADELTLTLSQGLAGLGASPRDAPTLSRTGADPAFTKAQFDATTARVIGPDWSLFLAASGQVSSAPLYASEAFGYGGSTFGRAFDASELIGDDGASISAEVRYDANAHRGVAAFQPFLFWDFGAVWNLGRDGPPRQTGSSTGVGLRFSAPHGFSGVFSAAWPVIHTESDPLYFTYHTAPRLGFQLSDHF